MPTLLLTRTHTIVEDVCRVVRVVGIFPLSNLKTAYAIPQAIYRGTEGEAILSRVISEARISYVSNITKNTRNVLSE